MSFLSKLFSKSPVPEPVGSPVRIAEVEATLQRLRPMLRADGGDVRLISVSETGVVELAWQGACAHCSVSDQTLSAGLEPALQSDHSWVSEVRIS